MVATLIFRAAFKPTPSIAQPQQTVTEDGNNTELIIHGRHDPIIVPRAVVVVEAMTALTLADMLLLNMSARMDKITELQTRQIGNYTYESYFYLSIPVEFEGKNILSFLKHHQYSSPIITHLKRTEREFYSITNGAEYGISSRKRYSHDYSY